MIKNPKAYLRESRQERKKYLRALTIPQSVRILESLLHPDFLRSFSYHKVDYPASLRYTLKRAKRS